MGSEKKVRRAETVLLEARNYVADARRFFYEEIEKERKWHPSDLHVSATSEFIAMEQDEMLRPMTQAILKTENGDCPNNLDDVIRAINAVTAAAKEIAAALGAKWGVQRVEAFTQNPRYSDAAYAQDEQFRDIVNKALERLEQVGEYLQRSNRTRSEEITAAHLREKLLREPLEAGLEVDMFIFETAYKQLQDCIITVAYRRMSATIWHAESCMGRFPLVRNGEVLKRGDISHPYTWSQYCTDDYTGLMSSLNDGWLDEFFDHLSCKGSRSNLANLRLLDGKLDTQNAALEQLIAGYLVGNQDLIMVAALFFNKLTTSPSCASVSWKEIITEGKHVLCSLCVTTKHHAEVVIEVKGDVDSRYVTCFVRRAFPEKFSEEQERDEKVVHYHVLTVAKGIDIVRRVNDC